MKTVGSPVRYALERIALRLVFAVLFIVFIYTCLPWIWSLFSPFIIATIIAALLEPVIRFSIQKLKMKRGITTAILVLLLTAIGLGLLYWFCAFAVVQIISLGENAPNLVQTVVGTLQKVTDKLLDMAQSLPESIGESIRSSLTNLYSSLSQAGVGWAGDLVNHVVSFAASLPYAIVYLNFLIIATIFITNRFGRIQDYINKRRSKAMEQNGFNVLRQSAGKGMSGYIRVQLLFALVCMLLSGVFFQATGFRYSFLIGLIAGLLELIPQFGCGVLYIPWLIICFIIGANRNGWLVLGLYCGYSLLRRVTEPALLGSNLGVSPLLSLIGMFVGMRLGGVLGLVLGPIVMVILASAVRSHMFDSLTNDVKTVVKYMRERWKRGREEEIGNAEK